MRLESARDYLLRLPDELLLQTANCLPDQHSLRDLSLTYSRLKPIAQEVGYGALSTYCTSQTSRLLRLCFLMPLFANSRSTKALFYRLREFYPCSRTWLDWFGAYTSQLLRASFLHIGQELALMTTVAAASQESNSVAYSPPGCC